MEDQYWRLPTGSSNSSEGKRQQIATYRDHPGQSRSTWIAHSSRLVFSAYRRDDFADPELYLIQLGMVLERYPDEVIREATSPVSGIQRSCKFPPSIAEIAEFCDEVRRRKSLPKDTEDRIRKQLDERDAIDAEAKGESLARRKEVVERIQKELAAKRMHILGGDIEIKPSGFRRMTNGELREIYSPRLDEEPEAMAG